MNTACPTSPAVVGLLRTCRLPVGATPVSPPVPVWRSMGVMSRDNRVRLLVVDDEPHIADLVATVARYEGWHAITAGNGAEAIREAAVFAPDIVVLDLMLPDIDGFAVLDRLRESGTAVPVVFLTARDGTADRIAGLTRGGDDYLVKPFSVEELMARLRAVLRRSGRARRASALNVADLSLDEDTREVRRGDDPITLKIGRAHV